MKSIEEIDNEITEVADTLKKLGCPLEPISEENVARWEKQWGVELPEAYRRFITQCTNGLRLNRLVLVPLEESMTTERGTNYLPEQLPADFLQKPFQYVNDFNPDQDADYESFSTRSDDEFSMWWLTHIQGTMLISEDEDGRSTFLVVTGNARHQIWCDLTVTGEGFERSAYDFMYWLKSSVRVEKLKLESTDENAKLRS